MQRSEFDFDVVTGPSVPKPAPQPAPQPAPSRQRRIGHEDTPPA